MRAGNPRIVLAIVPHPVPVRGSQGGVTAAPALTLWKEIQ
jgi:hypothetical protein